MPVYQGEKFKSYLNSQGITTIEAAKKLKVGRQTVYQYYKSANLERETVSKLLTCFGATEQDMFGVMELNEPTPAYNQSKLVYWVPVMSYGIFLAGIKDQAWPQLQSSTMPFITETSVGIEIDDDEMIPPFQRGDYFIGKKIPGTDWLVPGKAYYFATADSLVLRYFDSMGNNQLHLSSERKKQSTLPVSSVLAIYHKDKIITR